MAKEFYTRQEERTLWFRYKDDGGHWRDKSAGTANLRAARRIKRDFLEEVAERTRARTLGLDSTPRAQREDITTEEVLAKYLAQVRADADSRGKPATYARYRAICENFVLYLRGRYPRYRYLREADRGLFLDYKLYRQTGAADRNGGLVKVAKARAVAGGAETPHEPAAEGEVSAALLRRERDALQGLLRHVAAWDMAEAPLADYVVRAFQEAVANDRTRAHLLTQRRALLHWLAWPEAARLARRAGDLTGEVLDRYVQDFRGRVRFTEAPRGFEGPYAPLNALVAELGGRAGAAPKTVNQELTVLAQAMKHAVELGYLATNPARGIKQVKLPKKTPRFLSADEIARVLAVCSESQTRRLLLTFLNTGMRLGEVQHLQVKDMDLRHRTLAVRAKTVAADGVDWSPKSESRVIPVNDVLAEALREQGRAVEGQSHLGWLFLDGGERFGEKALRRTVVARLRAAGIVDVTKVHTLRDTFATHAVMRGVDLPTLQEILGHKDLKTTRIYVHVDERHASGQVAKLAGLFREGAEAPPEEVLYAHLRGLFKRGLTEAGAQRQIRTALEVAGLVG